MSLEAIDLAALIPADLPDGREAVAEGRALGPTIERATSLYCEEKGVGSEREWREKARAEGIPCTCMNIGLATWDDTREAMGLIYEDALSRGVRPPDRFNLLAERRMGLPKELRAQAPQETGPALWTDQHWWEMTHTVPIQPEAADNMIGGPGSVDNVVNALQVGITCIGVLSQYSWRWPYWDDETAQLMAVLKAGGVLASLRDQGVVFDSYLEDGYPGVFHDYASYVGWAMLERYVAEDLIGAAYSSSWGGLTQNPVVKSAVTLALDAVNPHRVPTSFIQGDTIGYSRDFDSNMAVLVNDLMMMKMTDLRYRLGGAPIAVPVTEVERIPTWQEVATVQTVSRKCEDYLPMMEPYVDWGKIEVLRDELVAGGKRFFRNALDAMAEMGVDVQDPAPVLLLLKRLGPETCEALFGAGAPDDSYLRGRSPILQTDLVRETMKQREALLAGLAERGPADGLKAKNVVVASTDVHEFAKFLLTSTLDAAGSNVIDCGINRDPEDIVKVAVETAADAVVITTHNGVARSYGTKLIDEMRDARLDALVFMGGVLNEDIEGSDVPVDVRQDLGQSRHSHAGLDRRPAGHHGSRVRREAVNAIALVDFGSTFTKLTITEAGTGRLLAAAQAPTTVETDVMEGYRDALDRALGQVPGKPKIVRRLAASSAGGGLRVAAIGLVPEYTEAAARQAALNAGARIVLRLAGRLDERAVTALEEAQPEIVLFSGGTDGGQRAQVLENAEGDIRCSYREPHRRRLQPRCGRRRRRHAGADQARQDRRQRAAGYRPPRHRARACRDPRRIHPPCHSRQGPEPRPRVPRGRHHADARGGAARDTASGHGRRRGEGRRCRRGRPRRGDDRRSRRHRA